MKINFCKKAFTNKYQIYIEIAYMKAIKVIKPSCKDLEVNIAFVSKREIKELNNKYRNVDKETDVLSFPTLVYQGEEDTIIPPSYLKRTNFPNDINYANGNIMIGDIYLCLPVCMKQAKEYKTGVKREIMYLAVHGLLHLLGYDHIEEADKAKMRSMEEKILSGIDA